MDLAGFKRILVSVGENATPAKIRHEYSKMPDGIGDAAMEYEGYRVLRQRAFERAVMRRMERFYDSQIDAGAFDEIMPIFKEIRKLEEAKDDVKKSNFYFITLCPKDKINPFELMKIADKFIKLSFIKNAFYVVEQRFNGEPNDVNKFLGDGLHIHILVDKGDYRFSHTQRDLKRICREYVMNIDIKMIRESDLPKLKNYMLGDKKDESKQVKQIQDKLYREKEGLRDHYGNVWF